MFIQRSIFLADDSIDAKFKGWNITCGKEIPTQIKNCTFVSSASRPTQAVSNYTPSERTSFDSTSDNRAESETTSIDLNENLHNSTRLSPTKITSGKNNLLYI